MVYTSTILILLLIISEVTLANHQQLPLKSKQGPNILLINIDDLGWRDLGFMGSQYYETPNIDQLAAEGMIFTNAYSASANCAPSRASLFSGQWCSRTGVYTVGSSERGKSKDRKLIPITNKLTINNDVLTIAQALKANGYSTCHVGKWHISNDPKDFGFDINFGGAEYGNPPGGYFSPWHNKALKDGIIGEYLTDHLTDLTIDYLKNVGNNPFFMNFATYAVHTPLQGKPDLEEKYKNKKGSYGQNSPSYAAMIETMDANVGRLIDYLKQSGKFKNTFIVFTSDNGGVYQITKQWPLRAGKGSSYEGGIRVPMIVVWPGQVKPESSTSQPVVNLDFFPTFLDIAGIQKPKEKILDGKSFLPVLKGRSMSEVPLYWHFPIYLEGGDLETTDVIFRTRPGSSIRQGPWVLQEYFEDNHLELYNLETDLGERKNLVHLYPAEVKELYERLLKWRARAHAPVPTKLNPGYMPTVNK
ncbi:MAG: sulfatase [Chitinophagaceae bacterium]